jgi:hypothetical protein
MISRQKINKEDFCSKVHLNSERLLVHYLNNLHYMEQAHVLIFVLEYLYQQEKKAKGSEVVTV